MSRQNYVNSSIHLSFFAYGRDEDSMDSIERIGTRCHERVDHAFATRLRRHRRYHPSHGTDSSLRHSFLHYVIRRISNLVIRQRHPRNLVVPSICALLTLQDRSAFFSLRYLCGLNCACA